MSSDWKILRYQDPSYPPKLKQIVSAPPVLYVWGNPDCLLQGDWLAVVGSRKATDYGRRACREIVTGVAAANIRVVSGLAYGIDITAHEAVLAAGGITVAVLGGGLEKLYPRGHAVQARHIVETGGAIISEFEPDAAPRPEFFPRRNRIISGLSRGVLLVEAAEKSGAMVTANYAAEQNRDLFCVPGPIFSDQSRGTNRLIGEGAKITTSAAAILEEWNYPVPLAQAVLLKDSEKSVFLLCQGPEPVTADRIVEQTGFDPGQVNVLLTQLSLAGHVKELPGKRYSS
ncbi:MAG: DNA-processing protein DprA [Deltaproteobacteria bacterium]|nr:DNA-processing protein DprA [Deltaproteobacteria bacterium]